MADLAVIIVSYNSARWLNACLASVYAHAGNVGLEVVVVDNASSDASVDVVEREFPDVRVVRNENRGFAHGNNRGFETVDAPFVLFLNPDTEIRTGTFETLLSYLREHPSVGLLGCRQLDGLGDLCHTIRRFPSPLRYLLEAVGSERFRVRASWMGERELDLRAYDRETECDWVAGSFMLARRAAVTDAGMMDERYFLYSEEPDLCRGVQAAGWAIRYVPEMTIVHYEGPQSVDSRLTAQRAYSRRQYMYKHEGPVPAQPEHRRVGTVLRPPRCRLEDRRSRPGCAPPRGPRGAADVASLGATSFRRAVRPAARPQAGDVIRERQGRCDPTTPAVIEQAFSVTEVDYPETDSGGRSSPAPSAAGLRTMVIVNRRNVVSRPGAASPGGDRCDTRCSLDR